jgi:hypothetical protein
VLRGGEGENCVDRVLEQGESGLDHGEIVGVAAWMGLPPKRSYARPQALEVYIPQCRQIKIYCMQVTGGTGGGAGTGTRDANQDRDGRMAGVDMSV